MRETNACPLANASAFWAGRVENWSGHVEFCIEHIRGECCKNLVSHTETQNCCYFVDHILKHIFLNESVYISIKISLKFVPKGPIDNIPALVHIMAWPRPGDKPWSEPMLVRLSTHICVTRPQWVNNPINALFDHISQFLISNIWDENALCC